MQRLPVWRIVLIVVVILLSLWFLMPTIQFYSYDPVERNKPEENLPSIVQLEEQFEANEIESNVYLEQKKQILEDFRELKDNALRLGLDLQGGVHLVIELDLEQVEEAIREDDPDIEDNQLDVELQYALGTAAEIIGNRVDQYGLAEAALVRQPPRRLILEMPGFSDPRAVANIVSATAELSFHLLPNQTELGNLVADIDVLVEEDFLSLFESPTPNFAALIVKDPDNVAIVREILQRQAVQGLIRNDLMFKWGGVEEPNPPYYDFPHRYLYLMQSKPELTGKLLEDAFVYFDQMSGNPEVSLRFKPEGANIFARVTGENVGRNLAIVMDDRVYSAPNIENEIRGGNARITGIGDFNEARQLAVVLRAGALPVPLNIVESRVVGPSLGQDSIQNGIMAGIIGAIIVLIFMVVYYALTGLIADFAVILNLFFLMACMALFKATLTLPGIAGIVLTIGMAVDANVLIFERLREEMKGKSKTIQLVLDKGYGRAFMTIFDANITTLITALVLFQFGTGPIKGFAITLSIGILVSMFTAIFVSRVIFDIMVANGMKKLNVGTLRILGETHIDFFKNPKAFLGTTSLIGIIGFVFLCANWQNFKGIDFAGGTEIVVAFDQPIEVQTVRDEIENEGLTDAVIQEVLGEENQMLIRVREGVVESTDELVQHVQTAVPDNTFTTLSSDNVGAKVGSELLYKAIQCVLFSSIGILLYITARFEFRFAVAAVAALFHDLFFTLAILAFTQTEFNLPIVAALLTVLGYSLNDTIVVFDRIRENYTSSLLNFREIVNHSINQTLTRTFNTSITTFFVILTLYFVGGSVIHDFSFTLLIGILIGTYSSIFVASPLLLMIGRQGPRKMAAES